MRAGLAKFARRMAARILWVLIFGLGVSFLLGADTVQAACAGLPKPRFEAHAAEVLDERTGLLWRRCSEGMVWTGSKCAGERSALTYGEAAKAGKAAGPGWRVPTAKELSSLIDASCGRPAIDTRAFPDVRPDDEGASAYWTSSPSEVPNLFYYVEFMDGFADAHSAGFALALRLVRLATDAELPQRNTR